MFIKSALCFSTKICDFIIDNKELKNEVDPLKNAHKINLKRKFSTKNIVKKNTKQQPKTLIINL